MMSQWFHKSSTQKFYGLSTDTKPTDCTNGSVFIELDTTKSYIFDEGSTDWTEIQKQSGGGILSISSLSVSQEVCELGSSESITVSWTLSGTATTQSINGTSVTGNSKTFTGVQAATTYVLSVSDGTTTVSDSVSVDFANNIYYGVATDLTDITSLDSVLSNDAERSVEVTAGSGEYIVYALPSRLGEVDFFVGGFEGGFEAPVTQSITNDSGHTESYYVYRSTNANLGETIVDVRAI